MSRHANTVLRGSILLPVTLAAACVGMPDAGPRPVPRSVASIESRETLAEEKSGTWPAEDWWRRFGDAQLDTLIEEGMRNSPDVAAASARLQEAAGMAREAGADLWPQLDAQGSVYQDRRSLNTGFSDQIRQFLPRGWKSGADISGKATFDVDIWGRNRAALAAATSEARASAVDVMEARLMLATTIAYTYSDLGQLYARRDIAEAALQLRVSSRELVSNRYANGLETRGSLRQADAEVATAHASLAEAEQQIVLRQHQIAALIGAGPDRGLAIGRPQLADAPTDPLPPDATTGLIGRRPDIVSARERVAAAASRIDVARADFFPAIRLDALIGLQTVGLDKLFEADSTYGRAGPAVSLPVFYGGALRGRYRAARGAYGEAVADYDRTVVEAYRQVADIVTSRAATAERLAHARDALAASQEAYSIAMLRYKGGLSSYLDALAVENRMLDARIAVTGLAGEAKTLDIQLIRALGGGFGSDYEAPGKELVDG